MLLEPELNCSAAETGRRPSTGQGIEMSARVLQRHELVRQDAVVLLGPPVLDRHGEALGVRNAGSDEMRIVAKKGRYHLRGGPFS